MKIGIIGQGFVGSAMYEGLKDYHSVMTYDIEESKCNSTLENICEECSITFFCLPTPMRSDGSCDIRILQDAMEKAAKLIMSSDARLPKRS